ncbi:MAG: lycopene beta-cyclase CrtY [Bdellovibrionaceae bacterium]|nr:lycopene beta-cyclase CrtY [Bdellovibrionales bacterium]MCB9253714.1 lycopene beta-cyclase CrtY [Pseudobdellovibrionaceae bacterium]
MQFYDLIFVGGGLANGLAAFRLKLNRPELKVLVIEKGPTLGGQHTWSFHDTDLNSRSLLWITPLITRHWDEYEVRFPEYQRVLHSGYNSIRSEQFHEVIAPALGRSVLLNTEVVGLEPNRVHLESTSLRAGLVLDGRGWQPAAGVKVAYQKFLGRHLRLKRPHALNRPVLMDATCLQQDGFRFFYLLPWSDTELFIEDTHYSDGGLVNSRVYRDQIDEYCERMGFEVESVLYEEVGSLPIPLSGSLPEWDAGLVRTGTGAGLFHATTGYSFPDAISFAETLSSLEDPAAGENRTFFRQRAEKHWAGDSFFRLLNRMLFRAALPEERYRVLQRFYRLSPALIQRFYRGQMWRSDRLRLLLGKPPVPVLGAIKCLRAGGQVA